VTRRAQSETLGFVLVFAIMVSAIGLVYAGGFSGLADVRDVERVNNAQRAFEVLADNMEDITQRNAPSRATEIKLAGASLEIAEPIEIEVNVTESAGGAVMFSKAYDVRPIVFDADTGTEIVYVQGAVIRQQGENGIVRHESTLLFNDSRTVIPIVQTRLDGTSSVGGSTTVLIRADHSVTRIDHTNTSESYTVWFNVTSSRAGTWHDYLEGKEDVDDCLLASDTASCKIDNTERVYLIAVKIDLALA